ncbi:pyruvate dehydrogenase (acetyl-transferring) E1 component subunit alpha [Sphingobacteriales bacterium UPWRP_1]|nr:pyruvate dehydrogenase (acetyl-transferring) E1 component subunit alpha [Sphingobacteriales bacterium TSM_CSM]PSJ74468.1 pyruvate dehydrogenase (acetyl-transferring) E1 component subunit alpha [Sphingobacteriales bacterium UPWRP_1]
MIDTIATPVTTFTKETYLYWYELMLLLRRFEEKAGQLYGQQKIRGFCHLYIGQEAVAAGITTATRKTDPIITAYRDHGLAMAKGISANACMAELYAKATGCAKGKGGSMHFFSKENYFFGGHGIVGAQIPLGAGIAFAEKYRNSGNVCITMFGDGAARQGALHESFNMAMLWKLPVVFICENNYYAMGTSVSRSSNVADIYKLGLAYDMPSKAVDGMTCESVHEAVYEAAELARNNGGPSFLEIRTYRYRGHSMSDPAKYRTKEEVEHYKEIDPLLVTQKQLLQMNYATEAELETIEEKIKGIVTESVEFAEKSPYPANEELYRDVYLQPDYPFIHH